MIEIIQAYGPVLGPFLFLTTLVITWGYYRLLREVRLDQLSLAMLLVEKDVITFSEVREAGLLSRRINDRFSILEEIPL